MPKVNIYLPDDLTEQARAAGLPLSSVCQQAIRDELDRVTRRAATDARAALADYVQTTARWREMVAEDYPDDDRNMHSVETLDDLAEWVRRLPDDDHRLARLGDWMRLLAQDVVSPSERGRRETSRYGFDRGYGGRWESADHDYWLDQLVGGYVEDAEDELYDVLDSDSEASVLD